MAGAKEPRMVGEGLWEPYPAKISLKMLEMVGLHIDFLEFLIILYVSSTTPPGGDRPPSSFISRTGVLTFEFSVTWTKFEVQGFVIKECRFRITLMIT